MMARIRQVRKTGFTIAPEAGSQRLRDVINKNLSEAEIKQTVADAFLLGWQGVKLYFMIGLPTETEEDHRALVDLVLRLRALRSKSNRRGQINVSVATFVPKAHTPFQWAAQMSLKQSEQVLSALREQLSVPGVQFKWQNPQVSLVEGVWARGDRRLLPLLIRAWEKGCRLDGWSDHFRFDLWEQAIEETGIDVDFFTTRPRSLSEPLPWDHIDMRVSRRYLEAEYSRALSLERTADCRWGACSACGVCDFERIQPVVNLAAAEPEGAPGAEQEQRCDAEGVWVRVGYQKTGEARFFGHLEMVSIFARAARRTGLSPVYTKGHHPKPRQVFSEPLPVGMESEREIFDLQVVSPIDPDRIRRGFNASLPEGLQVLFVRQLGAKTPLGRTDRALYRVVLSGARFDPDKLAALAAAEAVVVSRRSGKGSLKKIDLKDMIIDIQITSPAVAQMVLRSEPGRTLRPPEVLEHVFHMDPEAIRSARILKREPN
jgi:radical SAM-linked protein